MKKNVLVTGCNGKLASQFIKKYEKEFVFFWNRFTKKD